MKKNTPTSLFHNEIFVMVKVRHNYANLNPTSNGNVLMKPVLFISHPEMPSNLPFSSIFNDYILPLGMVRYEYCFLFHITIKQNKEK